MKKRIYLFFIAFIFLCACTKNEVEVTLASILTQGNGTWKVIYAKFGNEEAPRGMYDRFQILFKNGTYALTNPDGAITFALANAGKWQAVSNSNRSIIFDGQITVKEVSSLLSSNKLIFEWEVSIPGKVTTTYRIELARI